MITAGKRKQTLQNNSLQCGIQPQGKPFSQVEFSILYSSCSKDSNEVKGFSTKRDLNSFSIVTHLTAKPKKTKENKRKTKDLVCSLQVQACHFSAKICHVPGNK